MDTEPVALDNKQLLSALIAAKKGDFTVRLPSHLLGISGKIADAFNDLIELNADVAQELDRVSVIVGEEGKINYRAILGPKSGAWRKMIESTNALIDNMARPSTEMARVIGLVGRGDFSQSMSLETEGHALAGEFLHSAVIFNSMVEQLGDFASEVTRVAREVGTDGKLGGQARVKGATGAWKDLNDSVNLMASNLTEQVRNIAEVTFAIASGDLTRKVTVDVRGELLELKATINTMVDRLNSFASEVTRVAHEVGTDGKLGGQAVVQGVEGTWKDLTDNVNHMASNLTGQVRSIAEVTTAVALGDLSRKITAEANGEILELKNTINTMVDRLNSFASEVSRVALEVGADGILGGQAKVLGASGTWKDLTDNVNLMAYNLTDQVRGIAKIVTAIAKGNLRQKLTVTARGEIASLSDTINEMIDTLATFADQVTNVARDVGVEGKLGGQADVPGAAGTWKDLTDSVNLLAANLTGQVRAITVVATAVAQGDLTGTIQVEARGEVSTLKDSVNDMISNLRATTKTNADQDWLKTSLARFTLMMQGQREMVTVSRALLSELAPLVGAAHGVFYTMIAGHTSSQRDGDSGGVLKLLSSYGFQERKNLSNEWRVGEGLVGQAAYEKQCILLTNVPADYVQVTSGLGQATPLSIMVLPVIFEGSVKAVIELGSFERFSPIHQTFLEQLSESLGIVLNTIEASARTDDLLRQSQSLTEELQSQQEELRQTNEALVERGHTLNQQKAEVERKNLEVEQARRGLEEKAEQLTISSRYKSEFLSNMSHELRTPLNSLLLLSQQLEENPGGNLTEKQVEYAKTIHMSGNDLLTLITDILDLAKIESGTVSLELGQLEFCELRDSMDRTFSIMMAAKKLEFGINLDPRLPPSLYTDPKRLQQVIKNLLSNSLKFTSSGKVELNIAVATSGWSKDHAILNAADQVIALSVTDTGIGIAPEKQGVIFEAFQQADGSINRKYGGTGLGLAISREIALILGGEIGLVSSSGNGSSFTLYLPRTFVGQHPGPKPERGIAAVPSADQESYARLPYTEAHRIRQLAAGVDDRANIQPGDRVVLIIEDDATLAGRILDAARIKGFKGIVTNDGQSVLTLVHQYSPTAITLAIHLPDVDGWALLDRLKLDPTTRHIPIHVVATEEDRIRALQRGAFAYLEEPVERERLVDAFDRIAGFVERKDRQLLLVEGDAAERLRIVELISGADLQITIAESGEEAISVLSSGKQFDCMVLDIRLSGVSGFNVLETVRSSPELASLPIIIYGKHELTAEEKTRVQGLARSVVIVKDLSSPERLLDETALFLHRVSNSLPTDKREILGRIYETDRALAGRKVLIVDDDIRNVFALTSVLEHHSMVVSSTDNGRDAISMLETTPGIDIVLMDIMLPEMDGLETMRIIRTMKNVSKLPIIALTARAMKGDREKCIDAGASDYIAKPVDVDQLLGMLRVWLYS